MSCPAEAIVMNYSLGRDVSPDDRAHLARCKKCRKTLTRLESGALAEGLEMQGQASTFGASAPERTSKRSGSDHRMADSDEAAAKLSARYGW